MAWGGAGRGAAEPGPPWLLPASPPLGPSTPPLAWGPPGAGGGGCRWWRSQGAFPGTHAHLHADGGRRRNSNGVGGCLGPGLPPPLLAHSDAPYGALSTTAAPCPPKPTLGVPGPFPWVVGDPPLIPPVPTPPHRGACRQCSPCPSPPCPGTPTSAGPCSPGLAPHPWPMAPAGWSLSLPCPLPGLWAAGRGRRRWRAGGTGIWCALGGSPGFGSSPCPSFPSQHP